MNAFLMITVAHTDSVAVRASKITGHSDRLKYAIDPANTIMMGVNTGVLPIMLNTGTMWVQGSERDATIQSKISRSTGRPVELRPTCPSNVMVATRGMSALNHKMEMFQPGRGTG